MNTPRPTLQVMNTHLQDREFVLSKPVTIIGRSSSCDIDLNHTSVSRKHARIEEVDGAFNVLDLGSRNGTKVNGIDLPQAQLQPGDVLFIGEVQLRFDIMVTPADAAPPPPDAHSAETMAYTPADGTSARPLTLEDIAAALALSILLEDRAAVPRTVPLSPQIETLQPLKCTLSSSVGGDLVLYLVCQIQDKEKP